jgi:F0F1-type ATP synthase membrane subunit c/vacuolar-type H+-ATPase subunit K
MTSAVVVCEGLNVAKTNRKLLGLQFLVGISILAASVGLGIGSSSAQQLAATDRQPSQQDTSRKPSMKPVAMAAAAPDVTLSAADVKPARRSQSGTAAKGPYYVDFRARTAATYGHAFVWFGKTSEKQVEVAGLWPEGDEVPYMLGHLTWVPSGTGASYGDLDEQYLTASYRVYLNEEDAKKVFAYIKHLQATSPLWNAETTNCTFFIGEIASFMGLKAPFHLLVPEEYINQLKAINGGRQTAQLTADR